MKRIHFFISMKVVLLLMTACFYKVAGAQSSWPLVIESTTQVIYIYEPEAENYTGNELSFRSTISISEPKDAAPVFGAMWAKAMLEENKARQTVSVANVAIQSIRFADGESVASESQLIPLIRNGMIRQRPEMSMQQLHDNLNATQKEAALAATINHAPPRIIYRSEPSILVTIDGPPVMQATSVKGVSMVSNTPFLILEYASRFYLSNGSLWYRAASIMGQWTPETKIPEQVEKVAKSLRNDDDEILAENMDSEYPAIIVSTEPAELIQTDGVPILDAIAGTYLYYINNTDDYLILDSKTRTYYLLLAGRWYTASRLSGSWNYIAAENLPEEFALIPEGTEVDAVLANVPGTMAAQEAVMDAQIPQTAMVDRQTATTSVEYDGYPSFESIQGTDLRMASNSSNTVIMEGNAYYVVDNGVWFIGASPQGPWRVSDRRPVQVNIIPPSSPAYNVKYVYIYRSTPQFVYVGYTRGYLSGFVVGHTVVYGTGFHYHPWYGVHYYPRPWTWGFGMNYNPWWGWSVNFRYGVGGRGGWFAYNCPPSHRMAHRHYQRTGWWGPQAYRPPYRIPYTHYYGPRQATVRTDVRRTRVNTDRVYSSPRRTSSNVYYAPSQSTRRSGVEPLRRTPSQNSTANNSRRDTYTSYSRQAQPSSSRTGTGNRGTSPSSGFDRSNADRNSSSDRTRATSGSSGNRNNQSTRSGSSSGQTGSGNSRETSNRGGAATNSGSSSNRPNSTTGSSSTSTRNNLNGTSQGTTSGSRGTSGNGSGSYTRPSTSGQQSATSSRTNMPSSGGTSSGSYSSGRSNYTTPSSTSKESDRKSSSTTPTTYGNRSTSSSAPKSSSSSSNSSTGTTTSPSTRSSSSSSSSAAATRSRNSEGYSSPSSSGRSTSGTASPSTRSSSSSTSAAPATRGGGSEGSSSSRSSSSSSNQRDSNNNRR